MSSEQSRLKREQVDIEEFKKELKREKQDRADKQMAIASYDRNKISVLRKIAFYLYFLFALCSPLIFLFYRPDAIYSVLVGFICLASGFYLKEFFTIKDNWLDNYRLNEEQYVVKYRAFLRAEKESNGSFEVIKMKTGEKKTVFATEVYKIECASSGMIEVTPDVLINQGYDVYMSDEVEVNK